MRADEQSKRDWRLIDVVMLSILAAIVLALLLPLLNQQRGPNRRSQCATHVGHFARAAIQHEMRSRQLPGYVNDFGWFTGTTDPASSDNTNAAYRTGDKKLGSWVVPLLAFLDAQPFYEIWSEEQYPLLVRRDGEVRFIEHAAPNLPVLQCPESRSFNSQLGRNSYIANTGMHPFNSAGLPVKLHSDGTKVRVANSEPDKFSNSMPGCNGAFNHQYEHATDTNRFPSGPPVRLKDFVDGVGNTVLFSESLQAIAWHQLDPDDHVSVGLLHPVAPGDEVPYPFLSRYVQGMVWHEEALGGQDASGRRDVDRVRMINGTYGKAAISSLRMDHQNAFDVARPSSAHVRGVNCAFADGSTRFVSETIDYRVYRAMLTPCGREELAADFAVGTQ